MKRSPIDIITRARAEVRALCIGRGRPGGRDWTMCVPVQPDDSDLVLCDAIDLAEKQVLVGGRDVEFWAESYTMLRDAVAAHLGEFCQDDDVAEEAILIAGIEEAGREIARLRLQIHEATRSDTTTKTTTRDKPGESDPATYGM